MLSDFRKNALLSEDGDVPEEKVEAEIDVLEPVDLKESREDVQLVELKVDGHEEIIIVYREAWSSHCQRRSLSEDGRGKASRQ